MLDESGTLGEIILVSGRIFFLLDLIVRLRYKNVVESLRHRSK